MCLCLKESTVISGISYLKTLMEAYLEELGPAVHLTGRNHLELGCHEIWHRLNVPLIFNLKG